MFYKSRHTSIYKQIYYTYTFLQTALKLDYNTMNGIYVDRRKIRSVPVDTITLNKAL